MSRLDYISAHSPAHIWTDRWFVAVLKAIILLPLPLPKLCLAFILHSRYVYMICVIAPMFNLRISIHSSFSFSFRYYYYFFFQIKLTIDGMNIKSILFTYQRPWKLPMHFETLPLSPQIMLPVTRAALIALFANISTLDGSRQTSES